jgi:hypothetical protein
MMKFWTCALFLFCSACHTLPPGFRDFGVRTRNIAYASVQVVNDKYIVVSQEPIYVQQDEENKIFWSLPPGGTYYFLPKGSASPGIVFDPPQMPQTDCDRNDQDRYTYVCTYKKANKKKYTYTINVTRDGTTIIKSDPTVMND